jgi:glycosyltransferase involved in cell wall biosynthesis
MKLNWFSPLPPAATDIAHFTTRVLPALSSRADVILWTDQTDFDPNLNRLASVQKYEPDRVKWEELNRADACIYNLGNNPLFHGAIWQLARRHAGIVILHDTRLHHFFDGLYRVQWRDLPGYLAMMEYYYAAEGIRDAADCFRNEARNINEMAEKYPLTEHALENSLGVVVHTQDAFDQLSESNTRPVAYLPLPFAASPPKRLAAGYRPPRENVRLRGSRSGEPGGAGGGTCRLVMFGYIARNRRLEAVLQALSEMPERHRFHLDVFGEILDNEKEIKAQIRELGLKSLVTLHGFAPERELDEALSQADLAINLRYPTMGEASGSQLRIWAHALPSLVTRVGWYAALPDDAVAHVRTDEDARGTEPLAVASGSTRTNEIDDIQTILRAFLDDPARFAAMGQKGRAILEEQHSPEMYASGLIEFVEEIKRHRARVALYALAERTGEVTNELFETGMTSEFLNGVATQIRALAK